jgi:hypothetical protein
MNDKHCRKDQFKNSFFRRTISDFHKYRSVLKTPQRYSAKQIHFSLEPSFSLCGFSRASHRDASMWRLAGYVDLCLQLTSIWKYRLTWILISFHINEADEWYKAHKASVFRGLCCAKSVRNVSCNLFTLPCKEKRDLSSSSVKAGSLLN